MTSFAVLADPVRRRIVEILADGDESAGAVGEFISAEFGISQPAVSNHLRVLREAHAVTATRVASRQVYRLSPAAFADLTAWIERYLRVWPGRLEALDTELARGRRTTEGLT